MSPRKIGNIIAIAPSLIEHLDNKALIIKHLDKHMHKISQAFLHLTSKQTYELSNTDPILQLKITRLRELEFYRL